MYAYSIYKIRIDSGSWKDFDLFNTTLLAHIVFVIGTATCIVAIMVLAIYIVQNNILP